MLARKPYLFAIAAALSAILSTPFAVAETLTSTPRTEVQAQIARSLDKFESAASDLSHATDRYASSARGHNIHIKTHKRGLNHAKERVNALGRQLRELDALKAQGTPLQQMAISEARPHLEAVANHVQKAIVMLNEDESSHHFQEYRETVNNMQKHAENLYTKVDAITDYEKARNRAAALPSLAAPDGV
jgi:uncharacterized protein YdiU (UPF0061 family)